MAKSKQGPAHVPPDPGDDPVKLARSRKARASRNKGKRGERKILAVLAELWSDGKRNIQDRGATRDGPDIEFAGMMLDVEVKHRNRSSIRAAIKDAIANCREGRRWVAVDAPSVRTLPTTITMEIHDFRDLVLLERGRVLATQPAAPRPKLPPLPPGYTLIPAGQGGSYVLRDPDGVCKSEPAGTMVEMRQHAWELWRATASPEWRMFVGQFDTGMVEG